MDYVLSKRLATYLRREAILQEESPPWELHNAVQTNPYGLDYLLVLDFEATCEQVNPPDFIHEIIEFPVLMFNIKTLTVVSQCSSLYTWHSVVLRPCIVCPGGQVLLLLSAISKS